MIKKLKGQDWKAKGTRSKQLRDKIKKAKGTKLKKLKGQDKKRLKGQYQKILKVQVKGQDLKT